MADLTRNTAPSLATVLPPAGNRLTGLVAGEAITVGDLCYIKSDGKIWKTNGTAATAPAKVRGIALESAAVGEPVTLGHGIAVEYSTGLTPGADYYASTNAGLLSTTATTGGTAPVAFALTATKIFVKQSGY